MHHRPWPRCFSSVAHLCLCSHPCNLFPLFLFFIRPSLKQPSNHKSEHRPESFHIIVVSMPSVRVATFPCAVDDFHHDADRQVPIQYLCNLLLSMWATPPTPRSRCPRDESFVHYKYDASLFNRDPFYGGSITAQVPLPEYLQRQLCYGTTLPFPCAVLAIRLIDGYHRSTMGCVDYSNAHLLFGTALMISSKAHCDEVAPWSYAREVIGVSSSLLTNLEIILLFENRMSVIPSVEDYMNFRALLVPARARQLHLSCFGPPRCAFDMDDQSSTAELSELISASFPSSTISEQRDAGGDDGTSQHNLSTLNHALSITCV